MLIDSLTYALERSEALGAFWGKLDGGEDAALGVASSARPFMVAARFTHAPQPTLVVVAGEDADLTNVRPQKAVEHRIPETSRTACNQQDFVFEY